MTVTPEELAVLDKLGEAFVAYERLPVVHGADLGDMVRAIHAAQNIVLARVGMRSLKAQETLQAQS